MRTIPTAAFAVIALAASLLAACGKDEAPTAANADAPAAQAPVAAKDDDGGLFGFIKGDDAPAEPALPELGEFQVVSVALGSTLDADNNVRDGQAVFAPKDPIHAAVLSSGPHPGLTLVGHWTAADGTVVARSEQAVVATGPTVTTFSLRNAEPWPPGRYQFALQVEGKTLQSRAFEIVEAEALR